MSALRRVDTVKHRLDLIDQFADLVVGADDPRRLAERTLEVIMSLLNVRDFMQDIVKGTILVAAVGLDMIGRKQS